MSDKLLSQADALMRRRVFVAGANREPAVPDETIQTMEPIDSMVESTLEELPLLTDVVAVQDILPHDGDSASWKTETLVARQMADGENLHFNQLLLERQAVLTREIETWLDEQLPQLVIRAMDGITDHLVALLANRARDDLLPRLEAAMQATDEVAADPDSAE